MVKTKTPNVYKPLVVIGYSLFILLLVGTVLTTIIPWTRLLFGNFPHASYSNIWTLLVTLAIGSFLPVLIGYLVGDKSVKSKSKLRHHFNGVLFGLLAFWAMTLFAVIVVLPPELFQSWQNGRVVIANLVPSLIVAIVVTIIAIAHMRSPRKNDDIVAYKPFSILLIAFAVIMPLWLLSNNIATGSFDTDSIASLISFVILGIISWLTLHNIKLGVYNKLAWVAVSLSVFFVVSAVLSQLVGFLVDLILNQPTFNTYALVRWGDLFLALTVWIFYWMWQVRVLPKK